jgi:hypothetical protein
MFFSSRSLLFSEVKYEISTGKMSLNLITLVENMK